MIMIFLIIAIMLFMLSLLFRKDEQELKIMALFILIIAFFIGHFIEIKSHYKKGQVDAINGKIEFKLVKQPDGSSKWEDKGNI